MTLANKPFLQSEKKLDERGGPSSVHEHLWWVVVVVLSAVVLLAIARALGGV